MQLHISIATNTPKAYDLASVYIIALGYGVNLIILHGTLHLYILYFSLQYLYFLHSYGHLTWNCSYFADDFVFLLLPRSLRFLTEILCFTAFFSLDFVGSIFVFVCKFFLNTWLVVSISRRSPSISVPLPWLSVREKEW